MLLLFIKWWSIRESETGGESFSQAGASSYCAILQFMVWGAPNRLAGGTWYADAWTRVCTVYGIWNIVVTTVLQI